MEIFWTNIMNGEEKLGPRHRCRGTSENVSWKPASVCAQVEHLNHHHHHLGLVTGTAGARRLPSLVTSPYPRRKQKWIKKRASGPSTSYHAKKRGRKRKKLEDKWNKTRCCMTCTIRRYFLQFFLLWPPPPSSTPFVKSTGRRLKAINFHEPFGSKQYTGRASLLPEQRQSVKHRREQQKIWTEKQEFPNRKKRRLGNNTWGKVWSCL